MKAFILEIKNSEHIERGDEAAPHQRNAEQQLQRDRRANHFSQIASSDSNLAQNPEKPDERSRVMVAARLGEVAVCGDAELDAQMLKQYRHQTGNHHDTYKRGAEPP